MPDLETKLRFRAHSAFAVEPGARGGGDALVVLRRAGIYTRDPLQRHLRDVLAINQHFSFNFDIAGAPTASTRWAALRQPDDVKRSIPRPHRPEVHLFKKGVLCQRSRGTRSKPSQLVSATPSFFEYPTAPKSSPRGICSKAALYQRLDAPRSVAGFEWR